MGAVATWAIVGNVDTEKEDVTVSTLPTQVSDMAASILTALGVDGKPRQYTGFVRQEDLAELTPQTVPIPRSFVGLEAVNVPTRLQEQFFEIYEVIENEDEVVITARHIWYRNLQNNTLWKGEADQTYTGAQVCREIMANTIFPSGFIVASDCNTTISGKELDYERKNVVEAFLDPEKGVCKKFGLSLVRNNSFFYCLKNVGFDRGMVIQNGKNMLGVERTESIENLVTRVAPIAKDKDGKIVWMNHNGSKFIDSQYINEYPSPRLEIYDTGLQIGKDDVTTDNVQDKLLQAAQKRFTDDHVDLPEVNMTIEFLSLGDTEEYAQYRDLDKVYLYDIITVKDTVRGYNYSAQVIGVEHDILTGMLTSVTIGDLKQADASRKVAVWQVPEIDGANIRLMSIREGAFAPQSITAEALRENIISYAHIADATIDHLVSDSIEASKAQIHEIIAGSITANDIKAGSLTSDTIAAGAITAVKIASDAITADKITAGSVTADKIQSGAVTTEKLVAGAVTADKIGAQAITTDKLAAGAITADKISATDLEAIQAKLQIASIANAQIEVADIGYAQIKDLSAGSAYFGQAVFQDAVGGKLYVPRLSVGYAQMIGATIGDLVIQASNGQYYGIDVDSSGNVTATQRTVSTEEIDAGHTTDGRTLVLGTDILATDLNTENIYASHALMNEITAAIINVDELFAREATISKINAMDLSSNTYIRSTIGTWQSGSTITQTIDSLNSRISGLGYGTIYYSATEPSHSELVQGDIWVQPLDDQTWNEVHDVTWQSLTDQTWNDVLGKYKMYTWTGSLWRLMYDTTINATMETQIIQLENEIQLKATRQEVDLIHDQVTDFEATLDIQADQIQSAVSAVNTKASTYVMWADPHTAYTVTLGDIWIKTKNGFGSWGDTSTSTWQTLKDTFLWKDSLGDETYVWDGTDWIMTSDRASEIYQETLITQTQKLIQLEAETRAKLGETLIQESARLTLTSNKIEQEVSRAIGEENKKIAKTTQYQTADQIVSEAVRRSGDAASGQFILRTSTYQTAESIVNEAVRQAEDSADDSFIAKTTTYQTADALVTDAVKLAGESADNSFIAKTKDYQKVSDLIDKAQTLANNAATTAKNASIARTATYQTAQAIVDTAVSLGKTDAGNTYIKQTTTYKTADAIVNAAEEYVDDELVNYSTITQTANAISAYVRDNAYGIQSGIAITANGVDVSGSKHINLDINANNYVHLNSNGIEMRGAKVNFIDNDGVSYSAFGRDDIKVLKKSDNEQSIINDMVNRGKHDWVLIKPYYDATVDYAYSNTYNVITSAQIVAFGRTSNTSFADSGTSYSYTISGIAAAKSSGVFALSCDVRMSNDPNMGTYHTLQLRNIQLGGQTGAFSYTGNYTAGANLCGEGKTLYIQIVAVSYSYDLSNLRMHCTTDSATTKVPCTVYYFP